MSDQNWRKIDELFHATLNVQTAEREAFLRQKCGDDIELFDEVWSLVASLEGDKNFMEQSAISAGAKLLNIETKRLGQRIGSHKIISELGRGGMGTVYLALRDDEEFQQRVAIKLARDNFSSPTLLERFRRERQILAHLNHPNIARLLDGGTTENSTPYFVMEYVRGENIVEFATNKNLSVDERLNLFLKVCDAVSYAHAQGIIHRDIKPTNVLVNNDGEPKLLDFGIAKVLQENELESVQTRTGFHLFTPEYSSPEQARGENLSTATDVYSLGVLLYELLTTKQPFNFKNRSPLEIAKIVCENEPIRPSSVVSGNWSLVSETIENKFDTREDREIHNPQSAIRNLDVDLDNIILMAMRKEPSRRYESVKDFADDIRRYLQNKPVKARPNSIFYRSSKFVQRNRLAASLAACLLVFVGVFAWFNLFPKQTAKVYSPSIIAEDEALKLSNLRVTDDFLQFSSDNQNIFFVSNKQLYTVGIDGKNAVQIKTNQPTLRIAESPNGKLFAFSTADGFFVSDKNFTNPKKISNCNTGRFSWSPDNQKIVFGCQIGSRVNVFMTDLSGNEKQLTDSAFCSDPDFSPDGKSIVFACESETEAKGNSDIFVMNADGTNKVQLTKDVSNERLPIWSPDGNHIAFVTNRNGNDEIYLMNPQGEDVWRLTNSRGSSTEPAWSNDGKFIGFRNNRDGSEAVYLMNVEPKILAEKNADDIEPAFSPDGKTVVFSSNRHGQFHLFRQDADGKNLRQITYGNNANGFPRFSPDGTKIVFSSNRDGLDELFLMNADGTNQVRLTDTKAPSLRPAWSFDGKKIAFIKNVEGNFEIFTLDLFSGAENRLTFDAKNDDFPTWTPDGKIVFFSDRSGERNEVYQMNADGSNVINLTNHPANDGQMTVSKDGKIVFTSNRTRTMELWMMDSDGSNLIQLTNTAPNGFNSRPQFSADGTQIIYNSNENDRDVIRTLNLPK